MKEIVSTANAPTAIGPYSQGVMSSPSKTLYISGQLPIDVRTGEFSGRSIMEQTRQSILNLKAILNQAGGGLDNVVKTTVFLNDLSDFAQMNEVYSQYFNNNAPARSTVEVAALPKAAKVEIEAIAII